MPNIKSAKKRVLLAEARNERNRAARAELRTTIKKANIAIDNGDENMAEAVKAAVKKIDMAASKGLLHKNNAAHKKSNLVVRMNKAAK